MYRHLLAALDDSALAALTVSQAIAFARSVGARITFFHAAPSGASEADMGAANAVLVKALSAAEGGSVSADAMSACNDNAAQAIVDAALARNCDLIFMATRGPQRHMRGLIHTSVMHKVLQLTSIPVLVATIESNQRDAPANRAIAIIQDEHRSVAAVLNGLQHIAREARKSNGIIDVAMVGQMVVYMNAFPESLHHPKEEQHLFRHLRERTHAFDDQLDELVRQHAQEVELLHALDYAMLQYEVGDAGAIEAFGVAVERLAGALWEHMSIEETVILKAAREYLTEQDWKDIAQAFSTNNDPGPGDGAAGDSVDDSDGNDPSLRKMFNRIATTLHPVRED